MVIYVAAATGTKREMRNEIKNKWHRLYGTMTTQLKNLCFSFFVILAIFAFLTFVKIWGETLLFKDWYRQDSYLHERWLFLNLASQSP